MFPPKSLICVVTTASPIQTSAKTPEKTVVFCLLDAVIDSSKLRSRQKINGPLYARLGRFAQLGARIFLRIRVYQRSQSLKPSDMPPWSTTSASGHLPATPLKPPARLSPSPLSAPPMPPPLCSIPPSRYLGQRTCLNFSHTASRSRDNVSHTDSSMVFVGTRLSSPGIDELRYDWDRGLREDDDWMLPVNGARSEFDCRGSSRSLMFAASTYVSIWSSIW